MPPAGLCDLRDVVDAINELADSMRTSRDAPADDEPADGDGDGEPALEVRFDRVVLGPRPPTVELETSSTRSVSFEPEPAVCDSASALPALPTLKPEPAASGFESAPIAPPTFNPEPMTSNSEPPAPTVFDPEPVTSNSEPPAPTVFDPEPVTSNSEPPAPTVFDPEPVTSNSEPPAPTVFDPEPAAFDPEPAPTEPTGEMYYAASSEVSLLSDTDLPDRALGEDSDRDRDDRDSVMAGHVAAMRERFESMTRTNTPCPDLMRSTSPSFEVFRNISSSPDIEKT